MSAGHVGATCGSGILSVMDECGAWDVRSWWSMCDVYVFGSGWRGREGEVRGLALGFSNPVGTGGVLVVCLCFVCGGVGGEWVGSLEQGLDGWGGVMSV